MTTIKTFSLDNKKEASKYVYLQRLTYPERNYFIISEDNVLKVKMEERKRTRYDG